MIADYTTLLDAETWEFIRETARHYPPEPVAMPVSEQRQVYDRPCRAFHRGYRDGLVVADRVFGSGSPDAATVAYFHGGGTGIGGWDGHDDTCAEIADTCTLRVVSVDYRLSPEHLHPAAFDDALAATQAVAATHGGRMVLVGDSAGYPAPPSCAQ